MENLPIELLAIIFSYLPVRDRICNLTCVCKRWCNIIRSSCVWKTVNFGEQHKITGQILKSFVRSSTQFICLYGCRKLKCMELQDIFRPCKKIRAIDLSWIGYKDTNEREPIPDTLLRLNIEHLYYLNLSHCHVSNLLFSQLSSRCMDLAILILLDCPDISEETYMSSSFKEHKNLKLLCVAYNKLTALTRRCIIELLKYGNNSVSLDIRGNDLSDIDFDEIMDVHEDAWTRIKDIDEYCHMLPW